MSTSRPSFWILFTIIILLILFILLRCSGCKYFCHKDEYLTSDTTSYIQQTGLNVLFKDNVSIAQKIADIDKIKDSVKEFYKRFSYFYGIKRIPVFDSVSWCPCDSALYTINYTFIDGEGKSATAPPTQPPPKNTGPSGDLIDILTISQNMAINEYNKTDTLASSIDTTIINISNTIDNSKILAIMDSGIDSTLFPTYLSNLIWKDAPDKKTLYNFLPGQPTEDIFDNSSVRHGSAVTAIAIKAMENSNAYPRFMILKVLDSNDRGTTFSLSCALSYASKHHATMVNGSLGYKGIIDSVLLHYVQLCSQNSPTPIELFFAAGNVEGKHDSSALCNIDFHDNLLTNPLFYPSCFSNQFLNITSVTQLSKPSYACYYQYFSQDYITLGVLNTSDTSLCCKFEVVLKNKGGYEKRYYEGSSFATPYAAGKKMSCILNPLASDGAPTTTTIAWQSLIKHTTLPPATKEGSYIEH